MASVENLAAGARAVFFSVAYPDPEDGFTTSDSGSVFDQLEALFRGVARGHRPGLAGGARRDLASRRPRRQRRSPRRRLKPAQQPLVRRIHMDWRHIEVVTQLPFEFVVGGGLVGLVTMFEAVAGHDAEHRRAHQPAAGRAGRLEEAPHRGRAARSSSTRPRRSAPSDAPARHAARSTWARRTRWRAGPPDADRRAFCDRPHNSLHRAAYCDVTWSCSRCRTSPTGGLNRDAVPADSRDCRTTPRHCRRPHGPTGCRPSQPNLKRGPRPRRHEVYHGEDRQEARESALKG